jgi:sugar phosphate isomerase/epimerase
MSEAYDVLHPWIGHVHFHDGVDRTGKLDMVPVGEGVIDHKRAVELLAGADFDGYLSGEWINWEPWQDHLPRELATMKGYEAAL